MTLSPDWHLDVAGAQQLEQELAQCDGGRVVVQLETWGGALSAKGGAPLGGFEVAGADRVFHAASARIEGRTVVVESEAVPAPVAVRYAWQNTPASANLVGADGLPASPFRTDDWELP